jgi:two-component system chemotaxis response regulator CheB
MSDIKVLIVDDSAVVRKVLVEVLRAQKGIEVIGTAADPLFAMERMKANWPDVIVLDVEMPRMDGVTFLRKLMQERPTPVVICSTLTEAGAPTTLEALAAGAVTFITKPKLGLQDFLAGAAAEITAAIRSAASANVRRRAAPRPVGVHAPAAPPKHTADVILAPGNGRAMSRTTERIVALGTSTGGTQALEQVLSALPAVTPGIVIVQHMPPVFTATFAARLDSLSQITVKEARNNDREIREGPPVCRHCPSVDVLFRSVAKVAGPNALGVIMTGMGDDGARGLKEMRDAGAHTIAQDEASCVVFGMPKEALKLDAAERVLALDDLPEAILEG